MTHKILPSPENIRFEGERAWKGKQAVRFESLQAGQPVLTMRIEDSAGFMQSLTGDMSKIWLGNPHSRSVPLRGIENPGLLSIARLSLEDTAKIGVLESTDGFSRTVGAHKGSGIHVHDVLVKLTTDAADNQYRAELIDARDSGVADLESEEGRVNAARLRSSIMPRARVIVGYRVIGDSSKDPLDFHHVRRALVGHIHLEPPLKFSDTTQFALKANIALDAVAAANSLPKPAHLSTGEMLELLKGERGVDDFQDDEVFGDVEPVHADQLCTYACEAILSTASGGGGRVRVVNSAINGLTGKTPPKQERALIAADTALRINAIASGGKDDAVFRGKRSTLGRVLAAGALKEAAGTLTDVESLLAEAIADIDTAQLDFSRTDTTPRRAAATLGAMGTYALVDGFPEPLLERSSVKLANDAYAPEPQQIIEKMVKSKYGLRQLAQTVLDARAGRAARLLSPHEVVEDVFVPDGEKLTQSTLYKFYDGSIDEVSPEAGPLEIYRHSLRELAGYVEDLEVRIKAVESVEDGNGRFLIDQEGADFGEYVAILDKASARLMAWTQLAERRAKAALYYSDEDADEPVNWGHDDEGEVA